MENKFDQIVQHSTILASFAGCVMHLFTNKNKLKISEGNCLILESYPNADENNEKLPSGEKYLKMNNFDFCKQLNSVFVRITYQKSTSILFFNEDNNNVVYSISMKKSSPDLLILEDTLVRNGQFYNYTDVDLPYQFKLRIDFHGDNLTDNQIIVHFNRLSTWSKTIGNFFGAVSQRFTKPAQDTEKIYQEKTSKIARESFSEENKGRWSNIKEKAWNLNLAVTEVIKPLSNAINKTIHEIGQKYQNSENQYIKSIRVMGKEMEVAVNESYNKQTLNEVEVKKAEEIKIEEKMEKSQEFNETSKELFNKSQQNIIRREETDNGYPIV